MKTWSIAINSSTSSDPTPVPQSIRISRSTRSAVVRFSSPPTPPLQPRTLTSTLARLRSVSEPEVELHLDACQLDHIVVLERMRLRIELAAIDDREHRAFDVG